MCGIVAYIGSQQAIPLILNGLKRVEYRGYDSAGIAAIVNGNIELRKREGKIASLEALLHDRPFGETSVGIGHTRWATHGQPSDENAHPHLSQDGSVAIVHNGTIENHHELKKMLEAEGVQTSSQTDTELLAHLIEKFLRSGDSLKSAVQKMHTLVQGAYGIAVISHKDPTTLIAARHGSPLVMGLAEHGFIVASDATAIREHTDKVIYFDDGEMVTIGPEGYQTLTLSDDTVQKEVEELRWGLDEIAKGGHRHFMLKEIMEQPEALRQALSGRLHGDPPRAHLGGIPKIEDFLRHRMKQIIITACGTSWHAGLIAKRMFERLLRMPVLVEYASEFATSHTPVDDQTLVIVITQSGETKDTIEAAKRAKDHGATIWNICNVVGSSITRIADSGVYIQVGPEIGVASTKAFTGQVVSLLLTALKLVELRYTPWVTEDEKINIANALLQLPDQVETILGESTHTRGIGRQYAGCPNFLYLGRGYNFPTALEGALKLKEISYIHAEGYPAGEMKHGPIALIDKDMPVVVIAPREGHDEETFDKIVSNVEEVATRGGRVLMIASQGDDLPDRLRDEGKVERILRIPHTIPMLTPVLASVYLQLLAYHIAEIRGCDIDQPRNLAKSVTVE